MRQLLVLIIFTVNTFICQAQVNHNLEQKDTIFYNDTIPEGVWIEYDTQPEFPGGEIALRNFIKQHITYPKSAINDSIEGKVRFSFTIDDKGIADNVTFYTSIHPEIETECKQMIKQMPHWKPGTLLTDSKKGWYWRPIKCYYIVVLNFTLTNNKSLTGIIITP